MCRPGLTLALLASVAACGPSAEDTAKALHDRCFALGLQQTSYDRVQRKVRELTALGVRNADSAFADWAPLRPSDKAWYDEHCWNLKPRDSTGTD